MRFDTVIIGGGLSGLVCGLKLQKAGKRCAIVSAGQNAMHFFSGGFGLLSRLPDGTPVTSPFEAIDSLPDNHPYRLIGCGNLEKYASEAVTLLADCGVKTTGGGKENGWIISASGKPKQAWLALDDITFINSNEEKIGNSALIINIEGFLDFNTSFIAEAFEKQGIRCRIASVMTPEIDRVRNNPSEMRSSNIAKLMSREAARSAFMLEINKKYDDDDIIVLPAVFGLNSDEDVIGIRRNAPAKICFVGTLPPSVPGIRTQMKLKRSFEEMGGVFLMGDKAVRAEIIDGEVKEVVTENLGDITLTADNYVLASGSYFGHGLIADYNEVTEPVCGLDVDYCKERENWFNPDFFKAQKYIGFGVKTDEKFRARKDGRTITNLYVAGSILGGFNPLLEGSGSGVALTTALCISDSILGR